MSNPLTLNKLNGKHFLITGQRVKDELFVLVNGNRSSASVVCVGHSHQNSDLLRCTTGSRNVSQMPLANTLCTTSALYMLFHHNKFHS